MCKEKNISCKCAVHKAFFPIFLELPVFTRKAPSQVSVSPGSDLELCCAATGSSPPTVEWSRGQRSIDATLYQNGCLTMKNVKDEDTGKYICRATNRLGFAQLTTEIFLHPGWINTYFLIIIITWQFGPP